MTKRCRICHKTSRVNRWKICRDCEPRWSEKNERKRTMKKMLAAAYEKLTEGYDNFEFTEGCEICGRSPKDGRRLNVDHNHSTMEVRGLLCYTCNYGLPWFRDDPELLEHAAAYLRRKPKFKLTYKDD